ncbi:restriction endonuclease subunit S [Providencia stuartii]|uniref:restriction endonuclease subunit S n=1 Tax=Providencia stuartii TaxID=588 RepID=UPI00380D39C1
MVNFASMPKYDSYMNSGVEKVGQIPESWTVKRLKFATLINANTLPENTSNKYELEYVDIGSVSFENGIEKTEHFLFENAPSRARRKARLGDVVVSTVRTYLKAIAFIDETAATYTYSTGFAVVSPRSELHSKFLAYYVKSNAFTEQVDLVAKGMSYPAINSTELSNLYVVCAPIQEQLLIANYLDKKTALIDEAISIKEKQINLLKERKQIIIQQAVTQGLDPNVPMKDSGVDWIGKIPEHWEVKRIKHVGKIINGYAFPSDAFIQEGARVMKISNIQTMRLDWSDSSYVDALWLDKTAQFRIYKGDLVFALTRPVISTGIKAALVDTDEPILLNQRNAVFRPNDTCDKNWIYFVLLTKGFINDFEMQIDITGQQPNISTVAIGNLPFPLPPELEQKVIVSDLSRRCALLDMAVDDQIAQIERLKEYKTSLINSAVTGKIKITPEMVEQ